MEVHRVEQRGVVRYFVAEMATNADISRRMKHVYAEHCLSRTAVNNCVESFRQGRQIVKDAPRQGQVQAAITDASVDEMVRIDREVTTSKISEQTWLSKGTLHTIALDKRSEG